MLLCQRIIDGNADVTLKILGKVFKNMKALERDMQTNPKNFNENYEYSLIEPKPFLIVKYTRKATGEVKDILNTITKAK